MNDIKRQLKEIVVCEAMYAVKNKQRFSLRFYKKHPNKLNTRKRRLLKALQYYEPPREGIAGFNRTEIGE